MSQTAFIDLSGDWPAAPPSSPWYCRVLRFFATATPDSKSEASVEPSDEELVKAIVGGEPDLFQILITRYKGRVLGTASRFTRDEHETDDLAQEIFLKAWKGLRSFKATAPFEHWFMRLAIRVCYDHLRKNRRHRENEVSKEAMEQSEEWLTDESEGSSEIREREAREILQLVMKELRPLDRLILTLRELDGRSVRETAELTGLSETNVKVRAKRARDRANKIITENGYAD